jgi:hypothetical protein
MSPEIFSAPFSPPRESSPGIFPTGEQSCEVFSLTALDGFYSLGLDGGASARYFSMEISVRFQR